MKLRDIRQKIKKAKLDAFIISRNNMFINQDTLDEENLIYELTGFSGSGGSLLIFHDKAYLFVDGRYDLQAQAETNPKEVEVIFGQNNTVSLWLLNNPHNKKLKIGYNPWCHTIKEIERLETAAEEMPQKVTFVENDAIANKVSSKKSKVFEHDIEFAGLSREEKISHIAKVLIHSHADAYVTTAADSVSWLLNIRSDCLHNSPIVRAYAVITKEGVVNLFGDNLDFPNNNFKHHPMKSFEKELAKFKKKNVYFCFYQTPKKVMSLAEKYKLCYDSMIDPCQVEKSQKNPVELKNIRQAHIQDGVAISKLLHWLEKNHAKQTEISVAEKLYKFRSDEIHFFSNSFDTIAAFGSNAAMVHYHPAPKTNKKLKTGSMLLLDAGAQYLNGTTDITRTVAIGKPTKEMITAFTYVLKGHIALASTLFLQKNTSGMSLDIIARRELWKNGMEYAHGTGHGVGYFLNVHEGPNSISQRGTKFNLRENMITSIEPGYYKENEYGIRIENLYFITPFNEKFFKFEALTQVPLDKKLIDKKLLTKDEISWINNYHKTIFKTLEKHLEKEEQSYLKKSCSPL